MKYNNTRIIVFYLIVGLVIAMILIQQSRISESFMNPATVTATEDSELGVKYFKNLFGQIKRVSVFLLNKNTWSHGLNLHNKSPVELARLQLLSESQQKSIN